MDNLELRNLIGEILREMVESPLEEDNLISDNVEEEVLDEDWTDAQPVKAISRQKDMETDYFEPDFESKFES